MGYNTTFSGELKFTHAVTPEQLAALSAMFGEDCRDHPEWGASGLNYVDLVLTEKFDGIKWDDEVEKTYDLDQIVNLVISQMRKTWPEFGLRGELAAQGEDADDRWFLRIGDDGMAQRIKATIVAVGAEIECPHCQKKFRQLL